MEKIKNILLWFLGIIFIMGGIGFLLDFSFKLGICLILIAIILIPKSFNYINKYVKIKLGQKINVGQRIIIILILFVLFLIFIPNQEQNLKNNSINKVDSKIEETINNEKKENNNKLEYEKKDSIGKYEIIKSEDISHKALGNKSLTSYSTRELANLPIDKRFVYRIVFDNSIKNNQIKPTIEKIINDIRKKDNDIDEITLFIYSDKNLVNGAYDIGSATWAPKGNLGNITPEIAKNNIRTNYIISYKLNVKDIEKYFLQRNKKETKFNLSEEQRRKIFKEIVKAEDKAKKEAEKKYNIDSSSKEYYGNNNTFLKEKYMKNYNLYIDEERKLNKKYKGILKKQYNITDEEISNIIGEAFKENWPLR